MYRYQIALPLRLPKQPDGLLDYLSPTELAQGTPVLVKVRNRATLGIVWAASTESLDCSTLKWIDHACTAYGLPVALCLFLAHVAKYYHQPLGMLLHLAFPPSALSYFIKAPRQSLRLKKTSETPPHYTPPALVLTPPQQNIVERICSQMGFNVHLIHGITGSGKTEIYKHIAYHFLQQGKQILWLVPEIKLTPQLLQQLAPEWSDHLVALHSLLTPAQRFIAWEAAYSGRARLIIGTRLSVFTPLPDLGLIIVDEEHDGSFSQHEGVRYHARDVAVWRAKQQQCPILLGSATPSLESYINAKDKGVYQYHQLEKRAIEGAGLPTLKLIPKAPAHHPQPWSDHLDHAMQQRLERGEQTLLFLNRRGYAPLLHCTACGWSSDCPQCSVKMVWHKQDRRCRCHHCGFQQAVPKACPSCGQLDIFPMGLGTQKLEETICLRFPSARVIRVDQDSMSKKKAWEEALQAISDNAVDILIGTQMLAKGHHFPRLTLVGILGIDDALHSADFRAPEHGFAQLMQVAGRAGRAALSGEVLIETNYPDHPLFSYALTHNYAGAAELWKSERQAGGLPPFQHFALLWAECRHASAVRQWLSDLFHLIQTFPEASHSTITPPMPALIEKRAGWHRYYFMLHSETRNALHATLNHIEHHLLMNPPLRSIKWRIDVDPQSL